MKKTEQRLLALQANLSFPCLLKQTAPRKDAMWLLILLLLLWGPALSWSDVAFDGVDDFLDPTTTLSAFVATDLTLLAVVFPTVTGPDPGTTACFESGPALGDTGGYLAVGWQLAGWCGFLYDGANREVTAAASVNTWYEVALRLMSGTLSLWVDGVQVSSTSSGAPQDVSFALSLGASRQTATGWFAGRIAALRTYAVAVPDVELAARGKSRLRRVGTTPASGAWDLDTCPDGSGHGVVFRDRSGNSRHATGDRGANATGLLCQGSTFLRYPWGVW